MGRREDEPLAGIDVASAQASNAHAAHRPDAFAGRTTPQFEQRGARVGSSTRGLLLLISDVWIEK